MYGNSYGSYGSYGAYAAYSGMSTFSSLISLAVMIISIVAMWKILEKANEPGWKSLIPVYNAYMLFKIAWKTSMFWAMLALGLGVPVLILAAVIAAMVIAIILQVKLAKAFGKSGAFAVGLILLGFIFQCILAFGSAEYTGPQA